MVETPPAPPDPPQQLRVGMRTPTSVQLHWLPPRCCNGDGVNSYEVHRTFQSQRFPSYNAIFARQRRFVC